jgi:hypothetical protein
MMTEEQIKNHGILTRLGQLTTAGGNVAFAELADNPQVAWSQQRIFSFVSILEQRVTATPSALLSLHVLNQLDAVLQGVLSEVTAFVGDRNVGHLNNAVTSIDQTGFEWLSKITVQGPGSGSAPLGKLVDDFQTNAQAAIAALAEQKNRLAEENDRLAATIQQQGAEIKVLAETVAVQKADAAATVAELRATYAKTDQEIRAEFQKLQREQIEEQTTLLEDWTAKVADIQEANARQAAELLGELEAKREQAKGLVQIIGNIGVTGNYQKTAMEESKAADTWRVITLAAFIVAFAVGVWALATAHDVDWKLAIVRILFAFVVASVTVYTGRESARHRTNADHARRTELELASLGPYIDGLEPAQKNALRAKLAERYFGNPTVPHDVKAVLNAKEIAELLRVAIERK